MLKQKLKNKSSMKKCSICQEFKDKSEFYKNKSNKKDGLHCECKTCEKIYQDNHKEEKKAYMKIYRRTHKKERKTYDKIRYENNKEELLAKGKIYSQTPAGKKVKRKKEKNYKQNHPEKLKAQRILQKAVATGKIIKPNFCTKCGKTDCRIEAHHHSYEESKELDVVWLCVPCHVDLHNKLKMVI